MVHLGNAKSKSNDFSDHLLPPVYVFTQRRIRGQANLALIRKLHCVLGLFEQELS